MSSNRQETKLGRNRLMTMLKQDKTAWALYDQNNDLLGKGESGSFEDAQTEAKNNIFKRSRVLRS